MSRKINPKPAVIENINVKLDMTEEDKVRILNEVVEFSRKIDNLTANKKMLSETIKEHKEEIARRIEAVREGKVDKQVRCAKSIDMTIVKYHDINTGVLMHFREANLSELQMDLDLDDGEMADDEMADDDIRPRN